MVNTIFQSLVQSIPALFGFWCNRKKEIRNEHDFIKLLKEYEAVKGQTAMAEAMRDISRLMVAAWEKGDRAGFAGAIFALMVFAEERGYKVALESFSRMIPQIPLATPSRLLPRPQSNKPDIPKPDWGELVLPDDSVFDLELNADELASNDDPFYW